MIRGYALCRNAGAQSPPDPLADAFHALRLEMIAREARRYESLRIGLHREEHLCYLDVYSRPECEDDETDLRDFVMSLEDHGYGYLFWEVDTEAEAELLRSIDVACMGIERRGGGLPP